MSVLNRVFGNGSFFRYLAEASPPFFRGIKGDFELDGVDQSLESGLSAGFAMALVEIQSPAQGKS